MGTFTEQEAAKFFQKGNFEFPKSNLELANEIADYVLARNDISQNTPAPVGGLLPVSVEGDEYGKAYYISPRQKAQQEIDFNREGWNRAVDEIADIRGWIIDNYGMEALNRLDDWQAENKE